RTGKRRRVVSSNRRRHVTARKPRPRAKGRAVLAGLRATEDGRGWTGAIKVPSLADCSLRVRFRDGDPTRAEPVRGRRRRRSTLDLTIEDAGAGRPTDAQERAASAFVADESALGRAVLTALAEHVVRRAAPSTDGESAPPFAR